ncbi:hypothetical protein SSX86_008474 [Deinandra increscens subsp. villosa]|uniref:Ubiquitin-like protease family profile domain-containing protein n=1 Tax=Deinandra increscens subsp. villosa TaxID=3103831 RepID=A0AAP0H535_9ASTR
MASDCSTRLLHANPSLLCNKNSSETIPPEFVLPGDPMCDGNPRFDPKPNQIVLSQITPESVHTSPTKKSRKKLKVTWRHGRVRRSGRRRNNGSLSNSPETPLVLESDDPEMSESPVSSSKKRDATVEDVQNSKKRKKHYMDKPDLIELSDSVPKKIDVQNSKKRKKHNMDKAHVIELSDSASKKKGSPDVNDDDFSTDITLSDFLKQRSSSKKAPPPPNNHSLKESKAVDPEEVIMSDPTAAQDDPKFRSLRTRSSPIQFWKVNPKAIQKLLGVPYGGRKLKDGNPLQSRDPKVVEWRNRYPRKNVPPTKIVKNIRKAPDEDSFFFRMDFVMCFLSVLVECRAQGIEPDPTKNAISFWTMEKLKCREIWETKHGGFGKGKFKSLSKVVDDGSEKFSGFDISYLAAEVENDIMKLANVKSNLDHSFYQLKNNFPEAPQLKLLQDKYMEIISSGPINSHPYFPNSPVIGADSNPQHDPVADEQANHSAHELEQSHSSNRSKAPGVDDQASDSSDEGGDDDSPAPGVDDPASDSSDEGGDDDSPDQHSEAYSGAANDSSSDDEAEAYAKFCAGDSLYVHSNKYENVSLDDEAQPLQASAHHPEPLNQTHADHHYVHENINEDDQSQDNQGSDKDPKSDNQPFADNQYAPAKVNKAPSIVEEESYPSVVVANASVVETSKFEEEAPAEDTKTDNQASVDNLIAHEKNDKVSDESHHIIASILEELLESLKVQPSPVNIPSPQKAPETDDQLLSPATFKVSTDAGIDHVFCSPTHVELNKEVMQSLDYDKVVDIEVIRAWVDVLNFQELKRSSASPHRVFCPPNLISPWNLHDFSTDVKEKVESFSANLADYLDRIKINQHLKGVDLLLLPVEDSDSFYLMVFDLTNPSILVIDSFHSKKPLVRLVDSSDYYHKDSAYKMKTLVCAYLQSRSHQMSQRFKSMKISRVPIDWATSSYSIQNRIFLMRHMEKYYGQNKIFQCNFSKHGSQKNSQLNKLRNKYAAAIMLSEINILLPKIKSLLMS